MEIINDWSEGVSTFFRVLQHHFIAFTDMLRFQVTSRSGFEKLAAMDPASLTDLQRSARFLYLQRLSFGGKVARRTFGVDPGGPARFDMSKLAPMLEAIFERLSGVVIERLHWAEFIDRYDRPGTLFYLDPPYYVKGKGLYRNYYEHDDHVAIARKLQQMSFKWPWVVSYDNAEEICAMYQLSRSLSYGLNYTAQRRYVGNEVMFFSPNLVVPDEEIPQTKAVG